MDKNEFDARRIENPNTIVTDRAAFERALECARGCYQENLLRGYETLSGAGLRGKARSWAAAYARSRQAVLDRLTAAGVPWAEVCGVRGKRILVIGEVPA